MNCPPSAVDPRYLKLGAALRRLGLEVVWKDMERAWKLLPEGEMRQEMVLGFLRILDRHYKRLAGTAHPDKGASDPGRMRALNEARDMIRSLLRYM